MTDTHALSAQLKAYARTLGFAFCGLTTPDPAPHYAHYEDWLQKNFHGEMHYMANERSRERRANPKLILLQCQTIIVVALPYAPPQKHIAAYAVGRDYHEIIPPKLEQLMAWLAQASGKKITHKIYTDTGALLERDFAQRAGVGWIGKNTMLIHPKAGSYFLLGEVLIDLKLEPDPPFVTDHCGTCTRCIDACPTQAILEDRFLEATRCISYLTIEKRGTIEAALRPKVGEWVFGCDICQAVCPWNRFALTLTPDPALSSASGEIDLLRELELTEDEFKIKFKDSPIRRSKRQGYLRNVALAVGNSQNKSAVPILTQRLTVETDEVVREALGWALTQLG